MTAAIGQSRVSNAQDDAQVELNGKLASAASAGMLDEMHELKALGADPHAGDEGALRAAVMGQSVDACALLLGWGANPDACDGHALFMAIGFNSTELVALLLRAGANPHITGRRFPHIRANQVGLFDNSVMSPREYAMKQGRTEIVAMLDAADGFRRLRQGRETSAPAVRGVRL